MKAKSPVNRSGTAFAESFTLSKPSLAKILEIANEPGGKITYDALKEETSLGNNYVKAMPRYAKCCGLLEMNNDRAITPLGKAVYENDPNLMHPATLWLLHYHLAAPLGPGPLFWHWCIRELFRPGTELETGKLGANIAVFLETQGERALQERTAKQAAGIFLGSYSSHKEDALSKLGLLEFIKKDHYRVLEPPEPPPVFAIGYALAHYWESVHGDSGTINMSSLSEPQGFADLLYLSEYQLKDALRTLQREGLLELWRQAPPFQVVKLWQSKSDFLERLFL
jgi:hypothetical protein